ncbi:MAG TPA: phosphatidylserine/phosphatidylglycerophosphate/cardiolipin synthase family protein [Pseudomonas xinjiangensis]|uniref:Phosphatidylserine/phosphatidylglycerophosphate/ cardiolipin synthase family protein n=2 Tax=root TaxID=1 RepID=A0A7V1FRC6_9GAMM|nr:phosphatidylserine/phosphatidylglycerophosphate/cardiolipin synthase family protein [Halopseudomonas xinjiangensis]HEC49076.1 phosphatidylserine/phosphatidylglycerophosphate/cardiolipin synthase family protein [Halopseudomonas xinjiangensis]
MSGSVYPWREANQFELMVDGEVFFPRLIEAMQQAVTSIDIEIYLVSSGQSSSLVAHTLTEAVKRGVKVRCLLDGLGSQEMTAAERQRFLDGGIELRFYNPIKLFGGRSNLHRDHRKLLVVDRRQVFIGGTGFTDEFCQPSDNGFSLWHEQMLLVTGPVVADWMDLFERQWLASGKRLSRFPPRKSRIALPAPPPPGDGFARVSYTDAGERLDVVHALLANIARSQDKVWLATPYFLPSWRVRRALRRAARRGVDVRLLLSGQIHDHPAIRYAGQRYFNRLLKSGVRIYEYKPRFLHLKSVLVDNWISIGSCNFDRWSLRWNLEANQNAVDSGLEAAVRHSFETDFEDSREWTVAQWRGLPLRHRLKIWLWGSVNKVVMLWLSIKR